MSERLLSFGWITALAVALALWAGCARVVPPTGGPKDTIAPTLVRSIPASGSRNFHGKVVVLEFNEEIAVNTLNQQLIISPLQDNIYTYRIKGRRLELTFEKSFPDSSTIFLNFRDGVQDLNEKTKARDLRLAFSTWEELDTLMVSGVVSDLLSSKPIENATVGIWPDLDTTDIRRQKPQYLAPTDKEGRFRLENIKAGRYQMAAFADYNGNARWGGKREPLGFLAKPITLYADTSLAFNLSTVDEERPRIERPTAQAKAQIEVHSSEGLQRLDAYIGTDSLPRQPTDNSGGTFRIYVPKAWEDTLSLRLRGLDSAGNVRDTMVRVAPYRTPRNAKPDTAKVVLRVRPSADYGTGGYFLPAPAALTLPEPMAFGAPAPALTLRPDSQPRTQSIATRYNLYRNRLDFTLPYTTAKVYTLYFPKNLATTTGTELRGDTLPLLIATEEQVGILRGRLANTAPHTILELLTEQGQVVQTRYDVKKYEFLGLLPGKYVLRLTIDANDNHRRDPGRYSTRTLPEQVLPPSTTINIKANWEVEAIEDFGAEAETVSP